MSTFIDQLAHDLVQRRDAFQFVDSSIGHPILLCDERWRVHLQPQHAGENQQLCIFAQAATLPGHPSDADHGEAWSASHGRDSASDFTVAINADSGAVVLSAQLAMASVDGSTLECALDALAARLRRITRRFNFDATTSGTPS